MQIVKVADVSASAHGCLALTFSTGETATVSVADIFEIDGSMVKPLRNPEFFARVFVQNDVPTWANGFELDAIALYQQAEREGKLSKPAA